jgi:hypothetical protein
VPRRLRVPLACALLALLAAVVVLLPTLEAAGGHPSFLVRMAGDEPMARYAREADPAFTFVPTNGHYDGVYFYAIALDPLLLGEQHDVLTQPAYRYRSPLVGWLAGALAMGQAPLVPWALMVITVGALMLGAALVSLLAVALGASPWLGLLVALNPGLLVAVTVDTAEPVAMALIAAGLLAWGSGRRWLAGGLLVGAALSREIGALVAVGVGLVELAAWWRLRAVRPPLRAWLRRVTPLALAPAVYLAWWGYVYLRVGSLPTFEPSNLDLPLLATWETIGEAAELALHPSMDRIQLGVGMVPLLGAALVAILVGVVRAMRLRTIVDGPVVVAAVLVLSLNWLPMLYPKEMLRNTAILGVLLILSLAAKTLTERMAATATDTADAAEPSSAAGSPRSQRAA